MVMGAFRSYSHSTSVERIPRNPNLRSGFRGRLQHIFNVIASNPSSVLVILYYQGHSGLDNRNELVLSNGNGQSMHWADVADAVISARCDVLTILNCCHAGAAMNTPFPARRNINYERYIKEIMMAVPWNMNTIWGGRLGFAACLEQALREQYHEWQRGFTGQPRHWAEAISRIQGMESGYLVQEGNGLDRNGSLHLGHMWA
ncbi:hypothetical protein B0T26DRAFT_671007 [Lasiosphaeria miniovina]|uniref:Uncharacterized protein n=1 Tax=Lasiosphaeria miniovina TaxID=1954250 RepID=A0AA40ECC2_9PEZI|nr:uncharacterized protein B0T26DRAFT_671007 [Lasiosphaeria miniovina]KAK0734765.1 hypothetical protein B0T26DRAFT_671007 [Lasiosphaeria miniovina]